MAILNKVVFWVNCLFVIALFLSSLVPFIPSDSFPYLSLLGLGVPILQSLNLFFVLYWILVKRINSIPSALVLLFSYAIFGPSFRINFSKEAIKSEDLKVMSFNVRAFNRLGRIKNPNSFEDTFQFISKEDPDIICFQEMDVRRRKDFTQYPYQSIKYKGLVDRSILGIISKYPIVGEGTLDWPNTGNNGAFVDILYKNDTIRIYNLHLESFKFHPKTGTILSEISGSLLNRLNVTFRKQAEEAKLFLEHRASVFHKIILCGDFNNTQFSYVYNLIKGDMNDSYIEKGQGLGRTYKSLGLPFRIDFIMADPGFEVREHKNYNERFSDHYPVMASFRLKEQ